MKTSKLRLKEYGLEKYLPLIYRSQRIMDDSEVKWILLGGFVAAVLVMVMLP